MKHAHRRVALITLVVSLTGLMFGAVPVGAQTADAGTDAEVSEYVIVELQSPAAVAYEGGFRGLERTRPENGRFDPESTAYTAYKRHLANEHASFRSALERRAPGAVIVREYFITANAVAVELNGSDRATIARTQGAKSVRDSALYTLDMNESNELIDSAGAWARLEGQGNAGSGIKVGIIDSGIFDNGVIRDIFGDDFGLDHEFFGCKEAHLGGLYYSGVTGLPALGVTKAELPTGGFVYAFDHGTHVAGTVGGCAVSTSEDSTPDGVLDGVQMSGVAPGVELYDYNVFPGFGAGWVAYGGSAFSHDIAAAIEDSIADDMDVINMSLGGGVQGPNDFLAEVSNAAMEAGVVVVTSAGNEGPGPYTVGSPGSAEKIITVAASTNTRGLGAEVQMPGGPIYEAFYGDFGRFEGSPQTLVDWPGSDNEGCSSTLDSTSEASGNVVLIARGTCTFDTKITNAAKAGAIGVIVYSDDRDPGGMAGDGELPAVMVSNRAGLEMEAALDADSDGVIEDVVITGVELADRVPNLVAGFSSRGPAPFTGMVKPDVMAPGVDILSSVFVGFELFNGTSMASPHVAGAAALLLHDDSSLLPAEVKSKLVTSALGQVDEQGSPFTVWEQGSGLVNLQRAIDANATFEPTNASFGVWRGNKPVNVSVDVEISRDDCTVADVSGPDHASADIAGEVLTVTFAGGREAPTGLHEGIVEVACDGQIHRIPWGIAIDR